MNLNTPKGKYEEDKWLDDAGIITAFHRVSGLEDNNLNWAL